MSQSDLPENEDNAQKSNGLSSDEFEFYFQFTKPLVIELSTPEERAVAAAWVQKLEAQPETEEEKQSRLDYLKLLLFVLQRGHLTGIFKKQPPSGPLQPFAQGFTMSDLGNMMIERDDSQGCGGGDTRAVPYTIEISNDLREFVAAQEIPNFGVQMYYAWSSEEPIHEWSLFDEDKFPKHIVEKIKLLREIKSDDKTNSKRCSAMTKKKTFELPLIEKYSKKKVKTPQEIERSQGRSYHTYLGLVSRMGGGFKDNCDDDPERYGNPNQPSRVTRKTPSNVRKCTPGPNRFQGEAEEITPEGDFGNSCSPPAMIGGNNPNTIRICHCPCTHHLSNCEAQPQGPVQIYEEQATPRTCTKSGHDTSQFTRSAPRRKNLSRRLIYPPEIDMETPSPTLIACPQDRSPSPALQSLPPTPTDECSPTEAQNMSLTPTNERFSPDMTRTFAKPRNPYATSEIGGPNRSGGCDGRGGIETVETPNYYETNVIHCYDPQYQDPNVNLQLQTIPRSQLQPCSQLQTQQPCPQQQRQPSCPQQPMQQPCPRQQMQQPCPQQRMQQPCLQQHTQQPCQQRIQQPCLQQQMQQPCPQQRMPQPCPQQQMLSPGNLQMQQQSSEWCPVNRTESFQPCQESPRGGQSGRTDVCGNMGVDVGGIEEESPQSIQYMTMQLPCAPPPTPFPNQTHGKQSRASPGRGGRCPQQNLDSNRVDFGATDIYGMTPSPPQPGPSNCNQRSWISPLHRRTAFPEQSNIECADDRGVSPTRCPVSEPASDGVCPRTKKSPNLNISKHQPCATVTKSSGVLYSTTNASENINTRTEEKCAPSTSFRSGCPNDCGTSPCPGQMSLQSCLHTPNTPSPQCSPQSNSQWGTPTPQRMGNASGELSCLDMVPSGIDERSTCSRVPQTNQMGISFSSSTKRAQSIPCPNESSFEPTEYPGFPSRLKNTCSFKSSTQSSIPQLQQIKPPSRPVSPQQHSGNCSKMSNYSCMPVPSVPEPYVGGNEQDECESAPESADECPPRTSSNECVDEGNAPPTRAYQSPSNQEVLNESIMRDAPLERSRCYERPKSSERRMICSTPKHAPAPHVSAFLSSIYGDDSLPNAGSSLCDPWEPTFGAKNRGTECPPPARQCTPCPRRQ